MRQSLAENRLERKRYAVRPSLGHFAGVGNNRKKLPKTVLQQLFLKRVQEEMDVRGLNSRNALAGRVGGPSQTTFNDVMNGADPRLKTVYEIATALGIQPWELLKERATDGERREVTTPGKVHRLPSPYSPIFTKKEPTKSVAKARKKRQ